MHALSAPDACVKWCAPVPSADDCTIATMGRNDRGDANVLARSWQSADTVVSRIVVQGTAWRDHGAADSDVAAIPRRFRHGALAPREASTYASGLPGGDASSSGDSWTRALARLALTPATRRPLVEDSWTGANDRERHPAAREALDVDGSGSG
jgi:hypothetical protein